MAQKRNRLQDQVRELVSISSQAGIDDYAPILQVVRARLRDGGVEANFLESGGRLVGVWGEVRGRHPGPRYMLNATVDTAPFGELDAWTWHPLSAHVSKGWLFGRGSADSKAGVAVFSAVIQRLMVEASSLRGSMLFLFDADEHSGQFGGIRRLVETRRRRLPSGVMIGYPGDDKIVVGCRGFFRAVVTVHGLGAHSGSLRHRGINAISRAAELVNRIEALELPTSTDPAFPLPPQVSVTEIHGGEGYSSVPDACRVFLDFRLTPTFNSTRAANALRQVVDDLDEASKAPPCEIEATGGWPAYRAPDESPIVQALSSAAAFVLGREVPSAIVGPSSIGNYLATLKVSATSGFGVRYKNLHAPDECIEVATLEPVFEVYLRAARELLA